MTVLKNTRGVVARIRGEPTVPGMIPGGIASRPIPGRVVRTLGGELVFPGMIPSGVVSRPIPERVVQTLRRGTGVSWYDSRWCRVTSSLFIAGHLCL